MRIVMLDVGNTLVRAASLELFPHVVAALRVSMSFVGTSGPLEHCLVSDYPSQLPVSAAGLPRVFAEYLGRLPGPLVALFQPVEARVTISAHAGSPKPTRRVFEVALERLSSLGVRAELSGCVFVTENRSHVSAARQLGMQALSFGGDTPSTHADFDDWAEFPCLLAQLPGMTSEANMVRAAAFYVSARRPDLADVHARRTSVARQLAVQARAMIPLEGTPLGSATTGEIYIPFEVNGTLTLDVKGRPMQLELDEPNGDDVAEARHFATGLVQTGAVAGLAPEKGPGPTHELVTDVGGRRILTRRRFTTF